MSHRLIARWISLGAAATAVLCCAGEVQAQVKLRVDVGPPRGGSIHFGVRTGPPVVRVAPPASVRYEHYEQRDRERFEHRQPVEHRERFEQPRWGNPPYSPVYRHPYSDVYLRRFRPGYRTIVVGPTMYYTYPTLPPVVQSVVVNGRAYYLADGVYYQPYIYQGQTVYMVVPPPVP